MSACQVHYVATDEQLQTDCSPWCWPPQEVMAFQDLPFLPFTMQGHSRDSRQFPSHEEVRLLTPTHCEFAWRSYTCRGNQYHNLIVEKCAKWLQSFLFICRCTITSRRLPPPSSWSSTCSSEHGWCMPFPLRRHRRQQQRPSPALTAQKAQRKMGKHSVAAAGQSAAATIPQTSSGGRSPPCRQFAAGPRSQTASPPACLMRCWSATATSASRASPTQQVRGICMLNENVCGTQLRG